MLKLPKGLKKKKKGKKSKKDQELFTEEEFEQYKREHQAQTHAESEEQHQQQEKPKGENDEEWSRFAALTSDIDSILKRTQENLDHIKTTSFFQRVPPPSQKKVEEQKKAEEEAEERRRQEEAARKQQEEEEKDPAKQLLKAVVELSDSEEESDVDDSAFDTTFIDKVETGELPLAYVAEEEEEQQDLGPDPFDTGYAEKVIKGPEVSARGKKIVDIGAAVSVLTGKVEAAATTTAKTRRQRRGIQNLLLESFEVEEGEAAIAVVAESETVPKTILDEPAELTEEVPIDLSVSLHLKLQPKKEEGEDERDKDFEGFDIVKDDDELLAAAKKVIESEHDNSKAPETTNDLDWSEFELEREKPLRPPAPTRPTRPAIKELIGSDDDDDFDLGDDPFDTAYVEKVVPKPIDYDDDFDPRGAEAEDDDFNPRAEEENLFDSEGKVPASSLSVTKNDLLSASHNDLASIAPTLAPSAETEQEEEEIDPFDTSAVDKLVAPGKTELKYLEKELLESDKKKDSLSDDDFDPRADEEPKPSAESLKNRKSSLSLQIPGQRLVSFAVTSPDLLKTDTEASSKIQKPLTPYYTREGSLPFEEEEAVEVDPFDTSFVPSIAPTSIELDLIEKEILKAPTSIDYDDDFDPRAVTPEPPKEKTDLLLAADNHDIKVLTPAKDSTPEEAEIDPFDTSIANNIVPGTTELKLLEDELIEKKPDAPPPTDILSDTQDHSIYVKILTPQPTGSLDLDEEAEDFDPFDTSFATNLAPGETEIKLIESELIN
ncbi:hypothetical protein PVAND_013044 [Polypedilum vanderplanki]|uniref:Protein stoned-A n=1 Tax=Polypedilum vanderplanki TaxID=319348 RepID=A0A9J6CPF4_POLVA|nr:hypothetical protein PVAND_013044 [Polypedilum vanderplanki]